MTCSSNTRTLSYEEEQQAIKDAIARFPEEFGLRAFPGDRFRISEGASYYSASNGVMLYTQRKVGKEWRDFCKGTECELRNELIW